jgi:hypothetical protein
MDQLKGKRVRLSQSVWEDGKCRPMLYEATVSKVSGTMLLFTEMVTYPSLLNVPDTWINTASYLFNFMQVLR